MQFGEYTIPVWQALNQCLPVMQGSIIASGTYSELADKVDFSSLLAKEEERPATGNTAKPTEQELRPVRIRRQRTVSHMSEASMELEVIVSQNCFP